jgi:hypothetical protein
MTIGNLPPPPPTKNIKNFFFLGIFVVACIISVVVYFVFKPKKEEEEEEGSKTKDVNCVVSEFGECSLVGENCVKTRTIQTAPAGDGTACPPLTEDCDQSECGSKTKDVNCVVSEFGQCFLDGENCIKTRTIQTAPVGDGTACPPLTEDCDQSECGPTYVTVSDKRLDNSICQLRWGVDSNGRQISPVSEEENEAKTNCSSDNKCFGYYKLPTESGVDAGNYRPILSELTVSEKPPNCVPIDDIQPSGTRVLYLKK